MSVEKNIPFTIAIALMIGLLVWNFFTGKHRSYSIEDIEALRKSEAILKYGLKEPNHEQLSDLENVVRTDMSADIDPKVTVDKAIAYKAELIYEARQLEELKTALIDRRIAALKEINQ